MNLSKGDCVNNSFDTLAKIVDWLELRNNHQATSAHTANVISTIYNPSVGVAEQCTALYGKHFYVTNCFSMSDCLSYSSVLQNRLLSNMKKICKADYNPNNPDDVHLCNVVNHIGTHLNMGIASFEIRPDSAFTITTDYRFHSYFDIDY